MTDIWEYQPIIDTIFNSFFIKGRYATDSEPFYTLSIKIRLEVDANNKLFVEHDFLVLLEDIKSSINELSKIHAKTKGKTSIVCRDSVSEINFEMHKYGELFLSGQFNKFVGTNNYREFGFTSDQTIIPPLIEVLKELIS